ncbi:PKD domain-containing protein [Saccharothrix variisporea]|uniref:PKD domain-containing protein n=1 Tax=Saccharothrix variisporea TaxID=543527 RepID=UPI001B877681|nr:PKD domain-containing protein [Saccharothrix variisporea]
MTAALISSLATGVAHASPPTNDDFDQAIEVVTPFTATQSVDEATEAADDPGYCGTTKSVWFTYTAPASGTVTVSTAGSNYDTTLSAFSGTRGSLLPIGCDDDSAGGLQSRLSVHVAAGVRYHFKVAALSTSGGTSLVFGATTPTPPANDNLADATPIPALPYVSDVDISAATVEPDEPTSRCARPTRSIWYTLTVPETTSVTISEPSYYANLAVYAGNTAGGLDEIRCTAYSSDWLTFRATAGTTYHVRAGTSDNDVDFLRVRVDVAGPIRPDFTYYPYPPNVVSAVQFYDQSYVPDQDGTTTWHWDLGDGTTASGYAPQHRYAADGDYEVRLTVSTEDGRTATTSKVLQVRTHNVSISRFTSRRFGIRRHANFDSALFGGEVSFNQVTFTGDVTCTGAYARLDVDALRIWPRGWLLATPPAPHTTVLPDIPDRWGHLYDR